MTYLKVEGRDFLYRDTESGAILNFNRDEFQQYYADRDKDLKEIQEKQILTNKVNKLEEDVGEIKNLLKELIQMRTTNGN